MCNFLSFNPFIQCREKGERFAKLPAFRSRRVLNMAIIYCFRFGKYSICIFVFMYNLKECNYVCNVPSATGFPLASLGSHSRCGLARSRTEATFCIAIRTVAMKQTVFLQFTLEFL